jgi:hypothetical protein
MSQSPAWRRVCMLCVARCMLFVARCMLCVARCMLCVARCMLCVARCMLCVARCMLHVACCTLHVARCTLHAVHGWLAALKRERWSVGTTVGESATVSAACTHAHTQLGLLIAPMLSGKRERGTPYLPCLANLRAGQAPTQRVLTFQECSALPLKRPRLARLLEYTRRSAGKGLGSRRDAAQRDGDHACARFAQSGASRPCPQRPGAARSACAAEDTPTEWQPPHAYCR